MKPQKDAFAQDIVCFLDNRPSRYPQIDNIDINHNTAELLEKESEAFCSIHRHLAEYSALFSAIECIEQLRTTVECDTVIALLSELHSALMDRLDEIKISIQTQIYILTEIWIQLEKYYPSYKPEDDFLDTVKLTL